ncbi:CRIB domain-containing protein RIC10-like [Miscanthus floridulus]|uniref:CRIB domain-containing protein RIC10-like n=1 Tax=Miscanthus floridulus TaxID=154761 RepID=UPI00345A10A0
MAIAMKGIFRGLKIIAQIFTVQREHEIEIGYPTDVRHVSHVGLGASDSCPSWMNEFRGVEEVTAGGRGASIISSAAQSRHTSWASLDFFEQPATGAAPPTEACADSSSGQDGAARGGGPATTKKAARPRKSSGAVSPGGSSSWRSTACDGHSCELHVPAGLQAA